MTAPPPSGARTAWLLGALGLIPFFLAGAALWAGAARLGPLLLVAPVALLAYAVTISSFLGGVRWGVEIARSDGPRPAMLIAGVLPQIAAFGLAAAPLPADYRFGGLALLLAAQGVADWRAADLPAWYRGLRVPLTAGAVAATVSGLLWTLSLAPH